MIDIKKKRWKHGSPFKTDMADYTRNIFWVHLTCWGNFYWIWLPWLPKKTTGSEKPYLMKSFFVIDAVIMAYTMVCWQRY